MYTSDKQSTERAVSSLQTKSLPTILALCCLYHTWWLWQFTLNVSSSVHFVEENEGCWDKILISLEMEFKICQNAILKAATVDFMTFLNERELVKKHISVM